MGTFNCYHRSSLLHNLMYGLGEKSVGKSYALNHLVDTSFAGSAICTEGRRTHIELRDKLLIHPSFNRGLDVPHSHA